MTASQTLKKELDALVGAQSAAIKKVLDRSETQKKLIKTFTINLNLVPQPEGNSNRPIWLKNMSLESEEDSKPVLSLYLLSAKTPAQHASRILEAFKTKSYFRNCGLLDKRLTIEHVVINIRDNKTAGTYLVKTKYTDELVELLVKGMENIFDMKTISVETVLSV
ncbi:hypothetical protein [Helicobacter sp. 11S02629-2]|uniref:hypothetical protein n=1 Tax=Helicobacter sp. 11S02629-2 TaxID=1476195 RepID=UPI000BA6FEA2|nr:hypothetical protein [Helicobacter sp. 11S02629-2]PAF44148.1 hypothetical protein BKH40_06010 [Helicobacter sp. 11S02629-2]